MSLFGIFLVQHSRSAAQFPYENGEIASEKTLAMTRTMRFDGTLHVVIVHRALSLRIGSGHCDLILSLRAKRSNLSLINKQYLLIKGVKGAVKNLQKKRFLQSKQS
ncbi:MAG: hypothetical protein U0586_04700 [Candidatus Brocadiaceae bacterium]